MSTSPKALVFALYTHWDIVEWLVQKSRDQAYFEPEQLFTLITKFQPDLPVSSHEETLRKLCSTGILEVMARGNALQLNSYVIEFVRGLTREHELGLSAVLQARVQAIRSATEQLNDGLQQNQMDVVRQAAMSLSELFRQINQQLDQDRHAILEICETAKASDSQLSAAHRYRRVLETYDEYIEPMAQMMDSGASGTFYRYLEQAEHALDRAVEKLTTQGSLYSQRQHIRQVAFAAKDLRQLGADVLKQSSDTLLPLREELRQHNNLTTAISYLLGQVRKRGLTRTLRATALPVWKRDSPRRISVGDEVLTIMAQGLQYQPVVMSFPEESPAISASELDLVDEEAIRQQLQAQLPVADVLLWLRQHYGQFSDACLLRLYHDLTQQPDWVISQADIPITTELKTLYVRHYPQGVMSL